MTRVRLGMRPPVIRLLLNAAKWFGRCQAWLILTLVYFLVLAPIALIFRLLADPLHLRWTVRSSWHARVQPADLRRWARAQS